MNKSDNDQPALTFTQANAICRGLIVIGDQIFDYMKKLQEATFEAFVPWIEFVESFAETQEELDIHRRCVIEEAKELMGRPSRMKIFDDDLNELYFSPFLQKLREERDRANGVPVQRLSEKFRDGQSVWRREVDPCRRRLVYDEVNNRIAHETKRIALKDEQTQRLDAEVRSYATGLGRLPHTFDSKGRYAFFSAVMDRELAALGFRHDKAMSSPFYPIFSKSINDEWCLCWAIEDRLPFAADNFEGRFDPCLEIRSRRLRTLSKVKSGQFILLQYSRTVPGFCTSYWTFHDLDELERVIKAHVCLYRLMAPTIESAVDEVLGKNIG